MCSDMPMEDMAADVQFRKIWDVCNSNDFKKGLTLKYHSQHR